MIDVYCKICFKRMVYRLMYEVYVCPCCGRIVLIKVDDTQEEDEDEDLQEES